MSIKVAVVTVGVAASTFGLAPIASANVAAGSARHVTTGSARQVATGSIHPDRCFYRHGHRVCVRG